MFTENQTAAMTAQGADLLVSAAAGSGKTAVLTERIIKTLSTKNVERILTVTFTEAAAAEMRQRIEGGLRKQGNGELIEKVEISTIHSFCGRIVREYAGFLEIDPNFKIADSAELEVLKQEILEEIFENKYNSENRREVADFMELVDIYSGKYTDDNLRGLILEVYDFARQSPWYLKRLNEYAEMFNPENLSDLDNTKWVKIIVNMIKINLDEAISRLGQALVLCEREGGPFKYADTIENEIEVISNKRNSLGDSFAGMYDVFENVGDIFKRLPSYTKKDELPDEDLKERVKDLRDKCKKILKEDIKGTYFSKSPNTHLAHIAVFYPIIKNLISVINEFDKLYREEKNDRNILDFSDLEQLMLKVLYTEDSSFENPVLSENAYALKSRFYEILTDEYQDTNYIQEFILNAAAQNGRFMVGDVKQSIYKFRQAKPEIFIKKYNEFSNYKDDILRTNTKINLDENFRSRKNILDSVNFIFSQIMTKDTGDIDYDDAQALHYGGLRAEEVKIDDKVELHIIENKEITDEFEEEPEDENLTAIQAEARFVAGKIKEYAGGGFAVFDKHTGEYRNAEYGDIVVLVPSVDRVASTYEREFREQGITKFHTISRGGYFKTIEVLTVLSFLQIIDNPKQDIHFVTILNSPIYDFTCDELVRIRYMNKGISFYDCVKEYIKNNTDPLSARLAEFLNELDYLRGLTLTTPVSELILALYERTHYFEYAGAMRNGEIRQANLNALLRKAESYETTRFTGLFQFLKYIEKVQDKSDMSEAKLVSENVVRLMTIHSSKGLEFPIVFVSCGRGFNNRDSGKKLLTDMDLGFASVYIDLQKRIKYNTLPRIALKQKSKQEDFEERLRVLYVAFTRARDKLVLFGAVKDLGKKKEEWGAFLSRREVSLPKYYMLRAGSFLDFVCPAFLRHSNQSLPYASCDIQMFENFDISSNNQRVEISETAETAAETVLSDEVRDRVAELLNWEYPYRVSEELPSKVSMSEIKRLYYLEKYGNDSDIIYKNDDMELKKPAFVSNKRVSAVNIGTAIHTCMEHLDFTSAINAATVRELIENLVEKNLISREYAGKIREEKIAAFAESDIFKRIQKSKNVRREMPFVIALKPYEIYKNEEYKDSSESILSHGIIDLFFEEDDGLVLIDYKSDYISKEDAANNFENIAKRYKPQLMIYQKALAGAYSKPVKETYLYLISAEKFIAI